MEGLLSMGVPCLVLILTAFEILDSNSKMTYVSLSLNYLCLIIIYEGFLVITSLLRKMCEKIVFN